MAITSVSLGTAPDGTDGDTNRVAFGKVNDNFGTEVPRLIDAVSGGAGFVNASGAVTLDLGTGRAFHLTMTGNWTSLALSNTPSGLAKETFFSLVIKVDATGGYTVSSPFAVTWIDGSSWDDLDLTANAVNIVHLVNIGTTVYGAMPYKDGSIGVEPTTGYFGGTDPEVFGRPFGRAETLDLGNVTFRALDGTAAAGTLAYEKNGVTATGLTTFAAGDALKITRTGSTVEACISIPGFLG